MIELKNLTKEDIGKGVLYINNIGIKEFGRIKSYNEKWIFVVYNCNKDWGNYQNYTAAATSPDDLEWI